MKSYKFGYPFIFLFFCLIMLVSTLNPSTDNTRDEDRIHTVPRTNGIELSLFQIYSISDLDGSSTSGNDNHLLDAGETVDVNLGKVCLENAGHRQSQDDVADVIRSADDDAVGVLRHARQDSRRPGASPRTVRR